MRNREESDKGQKINVFNFSRTAENVLMPGQHYHEVIYSCDRGYKLSDSSLGHMFCQQRGWMGVQPYCEQDDDAMDVEGGEENAECEDNSGCEQLCRLVKGVPTCFCEEGYE